MSKISGLLGLNRLTHTRGVVLPTAIHYRTLGSHTLGSSLDLSQSLVPPNTAQAGFGLGHVGSTVLPHLEVS